jgi:hypothetical protein
MNVAMRVACAVEDKLDRQTDRQSDMEEPITCSSLTLERKERLKMNTCLK